MTDLQAQATAFAADAMREFSGDIFSREDMYHAYRDAYEQGWVDCETENERPKTLDEVLSVASDCRYFIGARYCSKGLPGTFCEREGCVAYYPKDDWGARQGGNYDYYVCIPLGDSLTEIAPYIYETHKKPDWSVNATIKRCTWEQVLSLSNIYPDLIIFKSKDVIRAITNEKETE